MKSALSIAPTAAAKRHISYLKDYHIRFFRLCCAYHIMLSDQSF